jgi:hypothetical protein
VVFVAVYWCWARASLVMLVWLVLVMHELLGVWGRPRLSVCVCGCWPSTSWAALCVWLGLVMSSVGSMLFVEASQGMVVVLLHGWLVLLW